MTNFKTIVVNKDSHNLRLDKFIKKYFSNTPYSLIQKRIRLGLFKVNNLKKTPSFKVSYLDKLYYKNSDIFISERSKNKNVPKSFLELLKKSIVFEDEFILVLNKPYGIPVQGGSKINLSIDDALPYISEETNTLKLTHRIDKNTTGILITAKSKEIAKNITRLFKVNKIKKVYYALVLGVPKKKNNLIKLPISKVNVNSFEKMKVTEDISKQAITYYQTLETKTNLSLIKIFPRTGRKHQIRIHMLSENCPILGDKKYVLEKSKDDRFLDDNDYMHLHAKKICFTLNKKSYSFNIQIPDFFLKTLKKYNFKNYN